MKNRISILKILQLLKPRDRLTGLVCLLIFLALCLLVTRGLIPELPSAFGFLFSIISVVLLAALALLSKPNGSQRTNEDDWGFVAKEAKVYPSTLVFVEDEVFITYSHQDSAYNILFHKKILNNGSEPIARIYARIAVNVFPDNLQQARQYYTVNPLEMSELDFKVYDQDRSELDYELEHDYDANKELFIVLKSQGSLQPVYPGDTKDIYYTFVISTNKWGPFIERNIRTETKKCRMVIDFPDNLEMDFLRFSVKYRLFLANNISYHLN